MEWKTRRIADKENTTEAFSFTNKTFANMQKLEWSMQNTDKLESIFIIQSKHPRENCLLN